MFINLLLSFIFCKDFCLSSSPNLSFSVYLVSRHPAVPCMMMKLSSPGLPKGRIKVFPSIPVQLVWLACDLIMETIGVGDDWSVH